MFKRWIWKTLRLVGNATGGVFGLSWFALAGLLILSQSASAAPVQIDYVLQNGAGTGVISGRVFSDTLAPVTDAGTNAFGPGTTTVKANHGTLGAFADIAGRATIVSQIQFQDTITIVSDTLAVGTPVDLLVSFSLDYRLSANCSPPVLRDEARVWAVLGFGGSNALQYEDAVCTGVTKNDTSAVFRALVGDEISLHPILTITASAGNCCESGHAITDALSTMSFFVDPVGSNFTYTSLTGSPYLSANAVPEPSMPMLFGAALAGLAVVRLRKAKA